MGFLAKLRRRHLLIEPGARVLEIGSGGRPHGRATILCDRYVEGGGEHREGRPFLRSDARPYLAADGAALPFRAGAFDYSIAMHVLEHVDDPARFLSEVQRISGAGYLETPSELWDWLFDHEPYSTIHKWYVNLSFAEDGAPELLIQRKTPPNARQRLGALMNHLRLHDAHLERFMEKRPELFTTQYEWRGEIRYRLLPDDAPSPWADPAHWQSLASHAHRYYWGSGAWGTKRWVYAAAVPPRLRQAAKRLLRTRRRQQP